MTTPPRVIVLGAGPAGLGAAFQLARRRTAEVTVLERRAVVGGNAGSFQLAGLNVDYGSHRLHPACDPQVLGDIRQLLGDDLLERPRHGRIRLRGRWIRFPLRPVNLLRWLPIGFSAGVAVDAMRHIRLFGRVTPDADSFASVLQEGLGKTICRDFYFPYARKIWGVEPEELSPIQARRRVQAGTLGKMIRKVLAAVPGFRTAAGGRFYYPRCGYGQLSNAYFAAARDHGARFVFNATVDAVTVSAGKVQCVHFEADGRPMSTEPDYLWSTIPLTRLVEIIRPPAPEDVLEAVRRMRFRALVLVYLVLAQKNFSEYDAHYFPEADVPISRMSEPRNYAAASEPADRTVLCAELPCGIQDDVWRMTDRQLGDMVVQALAEQGIPISATVLEVVTRRLPQAYPIYDRGYEENFAMLDDWLWGIENLLTFGRQGLFAHDNTHHALAMAYAAADCLDDDGEFDRGKWTRYRKVFESHVVED